jgi:hypothetical protein
LRTSLFGLAPRELATSTVTTAITARRTALAANDHARWRVVHVSRDGDREVLAEDLDLGFAQGVAEDYARRAGAGTLVNRNANWRRDRATDGQLAALRRFGLAIHPNLTKGEASDLITAAVAGRVA